MHHKVIFYNAHFYSVGCLDIESTHFRSTRSLFFQSRRSYQPAEDRVEAKHGQRPGPPPVITNHLLAESSCGPWVHYTWVEVSRGRFVRGCLVKAPTGSIPDLLTEKSLKTLFKKMALKDILIRSYVITVQSFGSQIRLQSPRLGLNASHT